MGQGKIGAHISWWGARPGELKLITLLLETRATSQVLAALKLFYSAKNTYKCQIELLEWELTGDTPADFAGFANENISAYASSVVRRPCCTKKADSRIVL